MTLLFKTGPAVVILVTVQRWDKHRIERKHLKCWEPFGRISLCLLNLIKNGTWILCVLVFYSILSYFYCPFQNISLWQIGNKKKKNLSFTIHNLKSTALENGPHTCHIPKLPLDTLIVPKRQPMAKCGPRKIVFPKSQRVTRRWEANM